MKGRFILEGTDGVARRSVGDTQQCFSGAELTLSQEMPHSSIQVDFKIATLVYLSMSVMAPAYLAADCQLVSDEGHRQLRSATSRTCVVRRTYSNYGDRCFAAAGPKL